MFARKQHIEEIATRLSWLNAEIDSLGSLNLYDINIHSETFFCELLNVIFDYHLKNLNYDEKNYTAIDLGDEENGIAIQVTSEKTRQKVQTTLDKFFEKQYDQKYQKLIILIIGKSKPNFHDEFNVAPTFQFSKDTDIYDWKGLLKAIEWKSSTKVSEIYDFLCKQLVPNIGFLGTGGLKIAKDMQQKAHSLCAVKLHALGISTDTSTAIIAADIESQKYQYILNGVDQNKHYLIGEFGSGKSHALYVLVQVLAERYLSGSSNILPMLARANEIILAGTIQTWQEQFNIGNAKHFLFIDGLDEIPFNDAKQLVDEVNYLSTTSPGNYILVSSRPLSIITEYETKIDILPLTCEEEIALFERITGEPTEKEAFFISTPIWKKC